MITKPRKSISFLSAVTAVLILGFSLQSCKKKEDSASGASFGAPSVSTILEAAAPDGLVASTSTLAIVDDCSSYTSSGSNNHLLDNFLSFMKCASFRENSNFAGPTYYRYWVDKLDETLSSIDTRFSSATTAPACLTSTAVSKTFEFTVDHAGALSTPETVQYPMKFNCYETDTDDGYNMAFGKDDDYYYVANFTTSDSGNTKILVLSRVTVDGNEADLWFLGTSSQSGVSVPSWANGKTAVANRVMANKSTGAFTYSIAEIPLGMTQQSNFIRSNGDVFYFKAQTADGQSVQDVVDGSATEFCRNADTLAAADSTSECTSAALNTVPAGFGISTIPRSGGTAFFTELKIDIQTISETDFGALGVKATNE